MNGRTAKLLRRTAAANRLAPRLVRRLWNALTGRERAAARRNPAGLAAAAEVEQRKRAIGWSRKFTAAQKRQRAAELKAKARAGR